MQEAHYTAARGFEARHFWLGTAAVSLGAFVGTAVFTSLAKKDNAPMVIVAVGMLSVLSAVLSALQTFLKHSENAEKHRSAGAKFAHLRHSIELVQVLPPETESDLRAQLQQLEEAWSKVRAESPNMPKRVWKSIERSLTFEAFINRDPRVTNEA
jgi:hypothetical protein